MVQAWLFHVLLCRYLVSLAVGFYLKFWRISKSNSKQNKTKNKNIPQNKPNKNHPSPKPTTNKQQKPKNRKINPGIRRGVVYVTLLSNSSKGGSSYTLGGCRHSPL
jgi:flagellar basal body-associated protein FliL